MNNKLINYLRMQKSHYLYGTNNHEVHNENKDYWNILLESFISNKVSKSAKILDYGCGRGRNVINLNALGYKNIYGVDISRSNINYCNKIWKHFKNKFLITNGYKINIKNNSIDYCISTITFQHICARTLRNKIFTNIYGCLKNKGIFFFQCTYSKVKNYKIVKKNNFIYKILNKFLKVKFYEHRNFIDYKDDFYDAKKTNGYSDMVVSNKKFLIHDLKNIGFKKVSIKTTRPFSDVETLKWIWVKCVK